MYPPGNDQYSTHDVHCDHDDIMTTSDRVLGASEACPPQASSVSSASAGGGPSPVTSSQIQTGKSHPVQGL